MFNIICMFCNINLMWNNIIFKCRSNSIQNIKYLYMTYVTNLPQSTRTSKHHSLTYNSCNNFESNQRQSRICLMNLMCFTMWNCVNNLLQLTPRTKSDIQISIIRLYSRLWMSLWRLEEFMPKVYAILWADALWAT